MLVEPPILDTILIPHLNSESHMHPTNGKDFPVGLLEPELKPKAPTLPTVENIVVVLEIS